MAGKIMTTPLADKSRRWQAKKHIRAKNAWSGL